MAFVSQLDPSLEARVNIEKQPVMLEEEYKVSRGGPSNQRMSFFLLSEDKPSEKRLFGPLTGLVSKKEENN